MLILIVIMKMMNCKLWIECWCVCIRLMCECANKHLSLCAPVSLSKRALDVYVSIEEKFEQKKIAPFLSLILCESQWILI